MLDTNTDISAFAARGGKLLLAHGLSDVLVSTRATEQYYQRLQAQMGPTFVDTFARYYEVPGLGHAVSSLQRHMGFADGARGLGREGRRPERAGDDRHGRRAGPHPAAVRLPEVAAIQGLGRREPGGFVRLCELACELQDVSRLGR